MIQRGCIGIIWRGRGDQQQARATGLEEQPFIGLSSAFQPTNDNLDPLRREETVFSVALYTTSTVLSVLLVLVVVVTVVFVVVSRNVERLLNSLVTVSVT